jgi:hypothetical protein
MFSALLYVHQIALHYKIEISLHLWLLCDNKGLVGKVLQNMHRPHPAFVSSTLSPDWDLVSGIIHLIEHMKGHYDK